MGEELACSGLVAGGAPALEALKGRIMVEIESKLSLKEEALWKRGQVEIIRLKQEQQQVKDSVHHLQDKQASLLNENQKIRGALVEVTSRFERVVKEMREVLQVLQHQGGMMHHTERLAQHLSPSPSVASTSASEAAMGDEPTPGTVGSELTPGAITGSLEHQHTPSSPAEQSNEMSGLDASPPPATEDASGESKTFCTPPRMPGMPISAEDAAVHSDTNAAWGLPMSTPSPAVLSLASALPSASALNVTPNPSPSAKDDNSPPHRQRLALAECLERQEATGSFQSPSSDAGVAGTPPSARPTDPTSLAASLSTGASNAAALGLVTVELVKEQGFVTLGMEVNQVDSVSLRVESVDEHGLVGRHNARQESDVTRVREGDRIVEVNNIMHNPTEMLNECKVQQRLALKLLRDASSSPALLSTLTPTRGLPNSSEANEAHVEEAFTIAVDEEQQQQDGKLLSSPVASHRLRPEATVFVPSAQKSVVQQQEVPMHIPPGLEYDTNLVQLQPLLSLPAISPTSLAPAAAVAGLRAPSMTAPPLLPQVGPPLSQPLAPLAPQLVPMIMEMRDAVASPNAAAYDDAEEVKRALFP